MINGVVDEGHRAREGQGQQLPCQPLLQHHQLLAEAHPEANLLVLVPHLFDLMKSINSEKVCKTDPVYQTFDDLTFAERTFADFWGRTFGTLTFGDQHKDIW